MRCPACDKQTITFSQWGTVANAFRWRCPVCSTRLKANRTTRLWFVAALGAALPVVGLAFLLQEILEIPERHEGLLLLVMLLATLSVFSGLAWRYGGYVIEGAQDPAQSREDDRS